MPELTGFPRRDGRVGARDHILVLPSVVCATHVAMRAAGGHPSVYHQHGCLHVGDDLIHTEEVFTGIATNPNVRSVVVVSLGCETLQGRLLRDAIVDRGQRAELVEIQGEGGSERAIDKVRLVIEELENEPAPGRTPVSALPTVGIDALDLPLADAVTAALTAVGVTVLQPIGSAGAKSHVELAARGAQIIVSLCGAHDAPLGSPVVPVISAAMDERTYAALADDFDIDASGADQAAAAEAVWRLVLATQNGELTAAELRGSGELVLERLAVTM